MLAKIAQIEPFSPVWNYQKAKISNIPHAVMKNVSNCRQKLPESWKFMKNSWLIGEKGKKGVTVDCFVSDLGPERPKIWKFPRPDFKIIDFLLLNPVESFSRHTSEVGNSLKWLVLDVRREKSWNMFVKFAQVKEFLEMAFWKTQNLHFSTYRPERCLKLKGKIKWVRRNQEIDLFHSQNLE